MNYIYFAWLTSFTYGLGSVIGKISTKHHISNPWLYNFIFFVLTALCIVPFAIVGGVGLPQDWSSILWLSVANTVSGTIFVLAFYAVDLSILSPLSSFYERPLLPRRGTFFGRDIDYHTVDIDWHYFYCRRMCQSRRTDEYT